MTEVALKDYRFILDYFELEKLMAFKFRDDKNVFDYFKEIWHADDFESDMETHLFSEVSYMDYRLS
jgi:hypothetical protein